MLFIGGTMYFKRVTSRQGFFPLSHLVGLSLFLLLGVWSVLAHPEPLVLHMAATGLFVLIAVWEWGSFHGGWIERLNRFRGPKA